ncbi:MAG: MFS transporter [Xanthomonadales bacterium]|nr:MFS transporter [Xanthomonadales bacterium]
MNEVAGAPGRALNPMNCLFAARALRDFGDSFVAILLPAYLLALGFTPLAVGVLATVSLSGSACLTIGAGLLGSRYGYRRLLLIAAGLMVASGLAFAASRDYVVLLAIAFAGTINPSAGNVSVFVPLEHAALAHEAGDQDRTRVFAFYSVAGALAAAVGALVAGAPGLAALLGLDRLNAMRGMFVLYALLGVVARFLYARLPQRQIPIGRVPRAALGPSRSIVIRLAALFSLDAFAGGFVVQSLLALWLFQRFHLSLPAAGVFFFCASLLAALSYPVAARLSRRFGLVNTMVFTHIPSSIALILAALAPTLGFALALLLVRAALSQMDVPTRSSYVMAVVTEAERPAAASFTSVPRSLASAASPAMAGALFAVYAFAWPLLICGSLKIVYDFLLLAQFRHHTPPEERRA